MLLAFRALLLLLPEEVLPDTCVWPEPLDIVPEVPVEEPEVPSDIEPDEPEPEVPVDEPEPEVPEPEVPVEEPEPVEEPVDEPPWVPPVVPCGCVEEPLLLPCVPWPIWDEEPLDWVSVEEPDDMEPEELEPDVPLRGVVVLGEEVWACAAVATPAASKVAKNKVVFIDVRSKG